MPELPEVETIRRQIKKKLSMPAVISETSFSKNFKSLLMSKKVPLKGKKLLTIKRKGKVLDFCFDGIHLISSLGMSGSWILSDKKIIRKHKHIQLKIKDNKGDTNYLSYVDPRRFGKVRFMDSSKTKSYFNTLGVDITSSSFTPDYIYKVLQKHKNKKIKPLFLDQSVFSGIGNYIASEICARSGIRPSRLAGDISKYECKKIKIATSKVVKNALSAKGTTLVWSWGYQDTSGEKGAGINQLVVFAQDICGLCKNTKIIKTQLGGRGTYYCPKCQK